MRAGRQNSAQFCSSKRIAAFARHHQLPFGEAMAFLLAHEIWPERFRRNYGLLTGSQQARLLSMPIFLAGCGGLGGEMAALLAHMGAGRITLCDYDHFEESNLNRQRFCSEKNLGKAKAEVAASSLKELASWGEFKPLKVKLTQENLPALISDSAIVIDCLDSVASKKILENAAKQQGKAWLHGSVLAHEGFACLESSASGTLSRLYSADFPESGAGPVLAHVVAGTAALMASLFCRWLKELPASDLLHCDFSAPELETFEMP